MIAKLLPAKVRKYVYITLATALGLEQIFDVVPGPYEGKVIAALAVLGFGLAAKNATDVLVISDDDV